MRRRGILTGMVAAGALGLRLPLVEAASQHGKLFVSVQARGGWDPTSFCDPKVNVANEPVINHWAKEDDTRTAGGIAYAPFANNRQFFEKYHQRMLAINGVDAQTNSHNTGETYTWSGSNSAGYPSLTALLAAHHGPDLPLGHLAFGGYSKTFGVGRTSRINRRSITILFEESTMPAASRDMPPGDRALLEGYVAARNQRLNRIPDLLPAERRARERFSAAFASRDFNELQAALSEWPNSRIPPQIRFAVLAFKTGLAVGADMVFDGFDTHGDHDRRHAAALAALTDGVDQLWGYAETHGVADRLVVVIGSDFGRTNHYNATRGKDHWPIGSVIVMEKNQPWTDRAVGETDAGHFARRIDPATLRRDDAHGAVIHPRHIHKALRRHLGVEHSAAAQRFPFHHTEDFAFFR